MSQATSQASSAVGDSYGGSIVSESPNRTLIAVIVGVALLLGALWYFNRKK